MIPWWILLIVIPASAFAGMWFTGGRWQKAWSEREAQIRVRNPYRSQTVARQVPPPPPPPLPRTHKGVW